MDRYLPFPPAKRQCTVQPVCVHGVIYKWCLDGVDADHHLYGIVYIGQVVRVGASSAEQALRTRTQEHVSDATRNPKDLGLHWAIRVFGADAFTVTILETECLPRIEAMEWVDKREQFHIAANGGVLKDPDRKCKQTLNLTRGGQGNPRAIWESVQARSLRGWTKLKEELETYYDENKNLRVPQDHVTKKGTRLGKVVNSIRYRRDYVSGHPEREEWLEARGFVWNERDAMWMDVKEELETYYDENKNLRVPFDHVTKKGMRLGKVVSKIRSRRDYVAGHPEREEWLEARGFVWNEHDAMWMDVKEELQTYYDENKNLRVPTDHVTKKGTRLGKVVSQIRSQRTYVSGHPEREEWLEARGFVWNERDAMWNGVKEELETYYDENKNLRVPTDHVTKKGTRLGKVVSTIRSQRTYVSGHPERLAWLRARGFRMHATNAILDAQRWEDVEREAHVRCTVDSLVECVVNDACANPL